jgi:hypothetical protein
MARKKNPEKRMGLGGHLRELRNRLFWSALFIIAGAVVGWIIFDQVFALLQAPIVKYAADNGSDTTINFGSVTGAFDLRMQTSFFLGILLASPFWLYNLWAFITPGLKKKEKRYTITFLSAAVPLFAAGCWLAWVSLPYFIAALIGFTPNGAANVRAVHNPCALGFRHRLRPASCARAAQLHRDFERSNHSQILAPSSVHQCHHRCAGNACVRPDVNASGDGSDDRSLFHVGGNCRNS